MLPFKSRYIFLVVFLFSCTQNKKPRQHSFYYCYYNITYYGKDWMMYSYGKTDREFFGDTYAPWAYYSFSPNDKSMATYTMAAQML